MCTRFDRAMHLERNKRCCPRSASARCKGLGRVSRLCGGCRQGGCEALCAVRHRAPLCCVRRFGPYCGWAHNTLFISELASMKDRLPPSGGRAASGSSPGAAAAAAAAEGGGSSQARKRQRKGSSSSAAADAAAPASEATSGEPEAALEAAAERAGGQRRPPAKAAGLGVAAEGTQQGLGAWRQRKAADLV